jgi:hypothetical protein
LHSEIIIAFKIAFRALGLRWPNAGLRLILRGGTVSTIAIAPWHRSPLQRRAAETPRLRMRMRLAGVRRGLQMGAAAQDVIEHALRSG